MKKKRKLKVSIPVKGTVREGKIDGEKVRIVEAVEPVSLQPAKWFWEFIVDKEEEQA